jgi:hypothetical protein
MLSVLSVWRAFEGNPVPLPPPFVLLIAWTFSRAQFTSSLPDKELHKAPQWMRPPPTDGVFLRSSGSTSTLGTLLQAQQKNCQEAGRWWLTLAILAAQEAEMRRIEV